MLSSAGIIEAISVNTSLTCSVVPFAAETLRQILDDPQVLPHLARQRQRLAPHLDLAVGVGDGAVLLRPGRGRQDHVCVGRRSR